jgi:hypothetical protein
MANANDYLKVGKYWKQSASAKADTASTSGTGFVTVVDLVGEVLVSGANITIPAASPLTVGEIRLTRDGVVEFIFPLTGATTVTLSRDLVGRFSDISSAASELLQGTPMYCKTDFKLEVRRVSGTTQNVVGTASYTLGAMTNV